MYHPYLRGKQFELITIRESAALLAAANFVPIVEPVKESLSGLERALDAVCEAKGQAIVVINPHYGDHTSGGEDISLLLAEQFKGKDGIAVGVFLSEHVTAARATAYIRQHNEHRIALIHAGFTDARQLAELLGDEEKQICHVFFEENCGRLYRRHFRDGKRVLLRDGFQRRLNREYPPVEFFSDLHVTFVDEGMSGFGDFLIVGNGYSETGGPAYAVAIHLTFIDDDKDDAMYVHHFVSKRQDTPTDPAGKFAEALDAMMAELNRPNTKIFETEAVAEFRDLSARGHFPGLGYIKKLSMEHHIETLAKYFEAGD
jgi:hypothetical protein